MPESPYQVFLNGKLVAKADAAVSIDSVAFKYAGMVFEGIRGYWNEKEEQLFVFRLADHARRLEESVRVMRMDTELTATDFTQAVLLVLGANAVRQDVHIRQMVYVEGGGEMFTRGPVGHAVVVTPKAGWFSGESGGIQACISSWTRISDNSIPPRIKCAANYQNGRLALLQARCDGYDATIITNALGKIAEEPRGCIFLVRRGEVVTPRITDNILESITRDTLIRLLRELHGIEVVQREVDRTELYLAQEVFVCGTGLEIVPVLGIDRHPVGSGKPGKITLALRDSYLQAARGEDTQYPEWLTAVHKVSNVSP
jgi:branched-chain amino acid aminotransferase